MKFTCTQENLHRGLQVVGHVASRNVTLPILNNVLLQASPGSIRLVATNLEIGISCTVRGKVETEGSFTVNAKLLADYVSLLPKDRVDVELEGKTLRLTTPQARTTMRGLAADEFPLIPPVGGQRTLRLAGPALKTAIQRVLFAAANDEARPEISGVYFMSGQRALTLAATDSYRLAEQRVALTEDAPEVRAILPQRALQELLRALGDEPVAGAFDDNQARFTFNDVEFTTRLIEGQYPDYRSIIPNETPVTFELDRESLITAVRQASLFGKQGIYDVTLAYDGARTLAVRAASAQAGESETSVSVKGTGDATTVVFNYRYLLDGLTSFSSEAVSVGLGTPASPGLLKPKGDEHSLYLIMPIRQ